MKKTIIISLAFFAFACSAWAQLDSIPISGTAIDTTKVYDGTTTANIITLGEYPLLPYSQVLIEAEAHYLDPSVGVDKPVVVTFTLSGADAFHYQTPESIILYADITPRQIVANSVVLQISREYDGTTHCQVLDEGTLQGILPDDTVGQIVTANYSSPNVDIFNVVNVTHTLYGPQAGNYYVTDSAIYLASIIRRSITAENLAVQLVKEYDGTDTAHVLTQPSLQNTITGEDIDVFVSAHYDTPDVGDNKPIYTDYQLVGDDRGNYNLTTDSIYQYRGSIVLPLIFDTLEGDQPFVATAYGFCQNDSVKLRYRVRQGQPVHYRIIFSEAALAAGFNDMSWVESDENDSLIAFSIPDGCPAGRYDAMIEWQGSALVSSFYPFTFNVNLPNDYLVVAFDDVISIDNSGRLDGQPNRFHSYQWMHNDEVIPNANKPYYQELGGLNGKYAVMVNLGTDEQEMVCPTFIYTATDKAIINLYPSPVVTTTTVKLQGFDEGQHQLQLFNSHGIMVLSATFEDSQYLLDLSSLPQGTYLVTVDGHSTKTLKL